MSDGDDALDVLDFWAVGPDGTPLSAHAAGRFGLYVLDDDGEPVRAESLAAWGMWFAINPDEKILARDEVGSTLVSTVFLGIDHNFSGEGPPVLWETMVFHGEEGDAQWRYTSREEALRNHRAVVALERLAQGKAY